MRRPCRLAALGVVNALGRGVDEIAPRLWAGDLTRLKARDDLVPERTLLVGEVHGALPGVPSTLRRFACRNNALSLAALETIGAPLGGALRKVGAERVAVVMGTSTSGVADAERAIRHRLETSALAPEFDYAQLEFGGAARFVAEWLGAKGPAFTLSTACSSGARALASARSLLALGLCDAVVAGATDSLCGLTANGFSALQAVTDGHSNPCSRNRRGLSLGEGSAVFLVTREAGGIQLVGVGESSEAHHMSAPEPEGRGAEDAMREALRDADLAPEALAYANLHGTGTPLNDAMECAAVERVLGSGVPCSSTKPLVGHTLGAAGAMEAAFGWMTLAAREGSSLPLPPHSWDGERDPELPELRLVAKGERAAAGERPAVLTNSFGFGGNNCTLVLRDEGGVPS